MNCMNLLIRLVFLHFLFYGLQKLKKIKGGVLDNRRGKFAGFLQAVFSTFLGTQPFLTHILPCLEELAKELQTKRHSTQYNNKSTTLRGKCRVCQSIQINFLGESVDLSLRVGEYVKLSGYGISKGTACLCPPDIHILQIVFSSCQLGNSINQASLICGLFSKHKITNKKKNLRARSM